VEITAQMVKTGANHRRRRVGLPQTLEAAGCDFNKSHRMLPRKGWSRRPRRPRARPRKGGWPLTPEARWLRWVEGQLRE